MRNHGAREQRKLAKQNAKKKSKQTEVARRTSSNPFLRLRDAARWPIVSAQVADSIEEQGIGSVVLCRRMPDGVYVVASILLDTYCLGAKDAWWKFFSPAAYREVLNRIQETTPLAEVPPEHALKLVEGAIAFAQQCGFSPANDARHALLLFQGIDAAACPTEFEYGKNGKPWYIRGPGESLERARSISAQVAEQGGEMIIRIDPIRDGINLPTLYERDNEYNDDEEDDEPVGELFDEGSEEREPEPTGLIPSLYNLIARVLPIQAPDKPK